jgi:prefoldin subunit 5
LEDIVRIRKEIVQKLEELQQRIADLNRSESEQESVRDALRMYERIVSFLRTGWPL